MGRRFKNQYHNHKKSKRNKHTLLWIILLIIIFFSLAYILGSSKFKKDAYNDKNNKIIEDNYQQTTIKNLAKNSKDYVGRKVLIKGTLFSDYPSEAKLEDDENYLLWIVGDCFESNRRYELWEKTYTVKGVILPPEECNPPEFSLFYDCSDEAIYNYRLNCSSPLE